ncbi:B12-binding domain-containing radical SAM protein [Chondromyces crocatus]|uniref:Oxidoreductase n=1 Tax=Chondromyces crocatus TaxID=52 RepID=A0A0K1EMY1_CHOCO|nr:B12-binding domain-containing radical SAM protein [Chondromyces crocatus]AKT42255.1 oxidoreductase [Chondromyces crocatus]
MPSSGRVALLSMEPRISGADYTPFSYGVRRIQAALLSDPSLSDVAVHLVESQTQDPEAWVAEVEAVDADLVGFSTYTWSFATFLEVARRLKRSRPDRLMVMGGPSARAAMFALPPWRASLGVVDALVATDGEQIFRDLVRARPKDREALRGIPGLHLSTSSGFTPTLPAEEIHRLDDLPSPARMGLIHGGRTVPLETYRGCPLSCAFCQWGDLNKPDRIFSEAYLTAELGALKEAGAPSAQLVDAALNLNSRAFRNLAAAERQVGFFRDAMLFACVYPTHLTEQHLEFLSGVPRACLDVGLQSFNKETLDANHRPFKESKFAQVIEELSRLAHVEVEIILGLPGDNPEAFRKTVERARELPCKVRVFHCLVLPDALMTRAPASFEMKFDPVTLRMASCRGWSEEALARERAWLVETVGRVDGEISADMWSFPAPERARRSVAQHVARFGRSAGAQGVGGGSATGSVGMGRVGEVGRNGEVGRSGEVGRGGDRGGERQGGAARGVAGAAGDEGEASAGLNGASGASQVGVLGNAPAAPGPMPPALQEVMASALREVTGGIWSLVEGSQGPAQLAMTFKTRETRLVLEAVPAAGAVRAYRMLDGVAFSYRVGSGVRLSDGAVRLLDRVLRRLHGPVQEALGVTSSLSARPGGVRRLPVAP